MGASPDPRSTRRMLCPMRKVFRLQNQNSKHQRAQQDHPQGRSDGGDEKSFEGTGNKRRREGIPNDLEVAVRDDFEIL